MMKRTTVTSAVALVLLFPAIAAGQEGGEDQAVIIPSQMELTDEQKADLQKLLHKKLQVVVKTCVGGYARPELFNKLTVQFQLRKSGDLRGGFVPAGVVESNMYVKSDEERAKLEEEGSFARMVVRNDRDLERCMKKGTREFKTEFSRIAATVDATYDVSWKASTPTLKESTFEVTKN